MADACPGLSHRDAAEGLFGQHGEHGRRRFARERRHLIFCPRGPCSDIVDVAHRGKAGSLHPVEPTSQISVKEPARLILDREVYDMEWAAFRPFKGSIL